MPSKPKKTQETPAPAGPVNFSSSRLEVGGSDGQRLVFFEKSGHRLIFGGPTLEEFAYGAGYREMSPVEALRVGLPDHAAYLERRHAAIAAKAPAAAA